MILKVNDVIKLSDVTRQIVAVRITGYTWIYPDAPDRHFYSEDSNDSFLELQEWEVVS